jgi:transposase InsO family protein
VPGFLETKSFLAIEEFTTLLDAKIMAEDLRQYYNLHRPHSTLKYQTPKEFTLNWNHKNPRLRKILAY